MPNYTSGVTAITCTGNRPEAIGLCATFLAGQTWTGKLQWIVVDDGADGEMPPTVDAALQRLYRSGRFEITVRRPLLLWQPGQNTLGRNLIEAVPYVNHDKVLFFEDDDHYDREYFVTMARLLDGAALVGDPVSVYYNVSLRSFRMMRNSGMASLCQTGMRAEYLPRLVESCKESPSNIDGRLWKKTFPGRMLIHCGGVVGMKGIPGRPGIGIGHRPDLHPGMWTPDPELKKLREMIGNDAGLYEGFKCQTISANRT